MIGSRSAPATTVRRLVARAMARTLTAYVVPDARMARDAGLDLGAAGVDVAPTPRHASVLLVVGELPEGLRAATAIVYAQMPRPRVILAIGSGTTAPLPPADVVVTLDQAGLEEGLARTRALVASHTWSETVAPFTAEVLEAADADDVGMDHGAHGHGGHAGHDMPHDERTSHETASGHDTIGEEHAAHDTHVAPQDDHADHDGMEDPEGPASGPHAGHGEHPHHATESPPPERHDHHGEHSEPDHGAHHGASEAMIHGDRAAMGHARQERPENGPHEYHIGMDRDDYPVPSDDSAHAHVTVHHDGSPEMAHDHHAEMSHDAHGGMDLGAMGHDMSGHDHHMMDSRFMSMVAMTQGLPRSRDGLPMEWAETAFGPLFPGLPAGLAVRLTLDGDTVAAVTLDTGHVHRGIAASLPGPAATLMDRLATLDPLSPIVYCVLAAKGIAAIQGAERPDTVDRASIGALERERVVSHLGWLTAFLELLGMSALAALAARLHLAAAQAADTGAMLTLRPRIERLTRDVGRTPMLRRRTAGIGRLDSEALHNASGPVTRASGRPVDGRADSPAYLALGFESIARERGDTHARLQTRLAEIHQSLDLIAVSATIGLTLPEVPAHLSGSGMATVETPRGAASLHLVAHHGEITEAHISTPSRALMDLVPIVTGQAELADALVSIASLDLSPWEIDR